MRYGVMFFSFYMCIYIDNIFYVALDLTEYGHYVCVSMYTALFIYIYMAFNMTKFCKNNVLCIVIAELSKQFI